MTANAQWALMGTLTDWSSGKAMTVSGSNATCTVDLPGKTTYTLKVKNSNTWYGRNNTTISATTTTSAFSTSGGDVTLNTDIPGTYTFSFNTSTKKLTVTYPTAPALHDITVRAIVPAHWTNDIYAHVWTSENGSGQDVGPLTKEGDYYVVTKNAGALYVIFKNGSAWSDKNQTVDLCYTEDVCLQINQSGSAKATATVIECGAVSKDITVKAVVPGAWENTITAWVWPTGGEGKEVTPTKDGNWYVVTENCIELNVIFKNGTGWNGNENQTANITGVSENTCYQISALNKDGEGKCTYTVVDCEATIEPEAKPEPTPTFDYYVVGSFNGWNEKDPAHGMTLDGEFYKATITLAAGENLVKVTNGTWTDAKGYSAMGAEYEEVSPGASDDNIQVDLTEGKEVVVVYNATTKKVTFEGLTEKAPEPTYDYYLTGSLVGGWDPKQKGIEKDGELYKATFTDLAAGEYEFKITKGDWAQQWNYSNLDKAYEEVSEGKDGEGNPNGNIKIVTIAVTTITVNFDATENKISLEGLTPYVAPLTYTVTVPAGTEKCFIAGAMNGWNFQEMTATANANEFTIDIAGARESDGYKYACKADWDYVEKKEDGNDLDANRTWSANDVVAKWGVPPTYTIVGATEITGVNWDPANAENLMAKDGEAYTLTKTGLKLVAGDYGYKVAKNGAWGDGEYPASGDQTLNIAENGEYTIVYTYTVGTSLTAVATKTGEYTPAPVEKNYYIAGTENLTGYNWKEDGLQLTKDGDLYKHTFSALAAGTYEFKVTNGTWTDPWGYNNLSAAYEEVSQGTDGEGNPNGNIKFVTEEAKNITVTFNPATGKIILDGLTEKAPAEPVTVYFINSGEWDAVACYYWGGLNGSAWPGVQMDLTAETYEAKGWNVYKVTFPGDNTQCIFTDNKAEGTTQTGDLKVQDGQYYCYANGIWYERLADVDLLDTRVYLKGDMNEWCTIEGWCDMFRKETVDGTVAYRTVYALEAEKTYEFKIEDAGKWLSNTGIMTKDNCTEWTFEESVSDNAKITTEYAGDYTFVWDMTTKKLSVVYPELVPQELDLIVTNMVFDEDAKSFSGSDNTYGIEFNLVIGDQLEYGVYSLDASSTVNFGGTPFTDVTGMIAPDMDYFASATAQVYGFLGGAYYQLNVQMSAGGAAGVPVEILDGVATVDDGTGELTISGIWEGDDIYVVAPGFDGVSYDCPEVWFYVGGTDWETASIAAFGPATITVEGNDVSVEGTVMSGMTGTNYDLFVIGTLPAEVTTIDVTLSGMVATPTSRMGRYSYLLLEDKDYNRFSIYNGSEGVYGNDLEVTGYLAEYDVTVSGTGNWQLVDGVETLTATLKVEDDNTTIYNVVATVGAATTIILECYEATYTITDPEFNEVTFTGVADGKEFTILVSYFGGEYYSEGEWGETSILGTYVEFDDSDAESYYLGGTYIDDASNTYEVAIFATPAPVEPTPDYTRTVTNKYGTICLPFGSTNYTGMELYECVGSETGKVYLGSVTTLVAGVPYIFKATGTELAVYSDGTTATTPSYHNGLHGTFTDDTEVAVGNYILKDNAICEVAATCWVNAYRAYIVWGELPIGAPQQMPGRKYIGMDVTSENEATGLDNIATSENAVKVINNGQLIIIRGGEKFNAQGQKL